MGGHASAKTVDSDFSTLEEDLKIATEEIKLVVQGQWLGLDETVLVRYFFRTKKWIQKKIKPTVSSDKRVTARNQE